MLVALLIDSNSSISDKDISTNSTEGCITAKSWTYEHDERLIKLVDDDLNPLCAYSPALSTEKDLFCLKAEACIFDRSQMIQPYLRLRDDLVPA